MTTPTGNKRDRLLTPFIERNLQLQGNKLPEAKYPPSFAVEFREENDNKISIICWSGLPGEDGRQTPIQLHMEAYSFAVLAKQAEKASTLATGTEFRGIKVNGVRKKRPGDENKGPGMGWDGTIFVGKDQQDCCYVCVMTKGQPKLKFIFKPSNWSTMVDVRTNEPAALSLVSQDYAEAWAAIVLPIASQLLINHPYDWKAAREARDGGSQQQSNDSWKDKPRNQSAPKPRVDDDMAFLGAPAGGTDSFDEDIPI